MPMRSEIQAHQLQRQRAAALITEVLIVVIFCLAGFVVSIYAAECSPAVSELAWPI
jgi:hypothetical protein